MVASLGLENKRPVRITLVDEPKYFSIHTHSRYSCGDALATPAAIVAEAKRLGYRGLGLMDHGNMAGSIELYQECMKAGIKPFPGSEIYLVKDRAIKKGPEAKRYHAGLLAYTTQGYRNLIKISTQTHKNFHNKPLMDLADMAWFHEQGWTEGVALTTGCFYGLVIQTLIQHGYEAARNVVGAYASWFDTYVEIQNHQIDHGEGVLSEGDIAAALLRIADELDLPVVITQDSHYVEAPQRQQHNTLKRLVSWGPDPDDALFPGDGFHLVGDDWMRRHHSDEAWTRGVSGLDRLLARHDLRIVEADAYRSRVPAVSSTPDQDIRRRCFTSLHAAGLLKPKYLDRLEEELDVIETSGMADYLLLIASICDFMRSRGIYFQTRGSAAGSLVCWQLGISNIDPIRWGARFDRFLSRDRTKQPDVDLDVENLRRKEVMAWIDERYSMAQICTWSVLGMSEDPRTPGKGSLRVKYFAKRRMLLKEKGINPGADDWDSVPLNDQNEIYSLARMEAFAGYGVHACGLVLVNSRAELEEMVPMQWVASSKTMVTQYDGPIIESLGLVKADLLGSKTMSVLRQTCNFMDIETSALEKIPLTVSKVYTMIGRGDTDGFYQMEGYTTQKGCKDLRPRKISEVIDAMALFRPGVMNSGSTDVYIDRKFGREEIPQRHPLIARNTEATRGILLYQDHIITILRDLGMVPEDVTALLGAVKASNKKVEKARKVLDHYMPIVERMCRDQGMNDDDWAWLQHAFQAFAEYSFNVAHATVYGLTAYRCAWLAIHQPVEFHAALLAVAAGTEKEANYVRVTRRRGVRILKPDVNISGEVYAVDKRRNAIRRGLLSIDGIGIAMARDLVAHQPYDDWDDFLTKCIGTKVTGAKPMAQARKRGRITEDDLVGTVKFLYRSGACNDSLGQIPIEVWEHQDPIEGARDDTDSEVRRLQPGSARQIEGSPGDDPVTVSGGVVLA